ncbi:serine hydrolase domain-containing protein [Bacillus sp. PS06]|uniref:serine hydrolase domain-containing protein n=1 Tax=Bacillus sp. PS06 TaxID=2764176 RepID=UPI001784A673|nr:serine hydrolase domain-containing protein [Bacillus sp. PS06]MBD8068714.1 beta-lactamase family protein [Bacillus sp. PS06]
MLKWSVFEEYVQALMKEEHIAGVAVAVSKDGELIYENGFGYRDIVTKDPVTKDTIFGIASISKSMTALAIMKLQSEGKLHVDDPVITYLPDFTLPHLEDMSTVRIHHLLTHSVGLPPMDRKEELNKFNEHIHYLATSSYTPLGEPGTYLSYCNDTFLLLGAIIEKVTGCLYRRYMTGHILNPLGMVRSTYSLEEVSKYENVTVPYNFQSEENRLVEASWPSLGNYEVGGGVRSTVIDLLKYGQVYLDKDIMDTLGMREDVLVEMREPRFQVDRASYYGYALRTTPDYHGVSLVEHGGSQPGVSSNFGFIPEEKLVISVLTNVTGVSVRTIWQAAVNTVLGVALEEQPGVEPIYEITEDELQPLLGTYGAPENDSRIRIYLDNGAIMAEAFGEVVELRASTPQTLVIKKNERPMTFYVNHDGEAWAVFLGLRMYQRVL